MQFLIASRKFLWKNPVSGQRKNCAVTYEKRQENRDGITVISRLDKFFLFIIDNAFCKRYYLRVRY